MAAYLPFLSQVGGVIHVGANEGQERDDYRAAGVRVVHIEPIPEIYDRLCENLVGYPNQIAIRGLVTDHDGRETTFHVSNCQGLCSSIYPMAEHLEVWPDAKYERTITLETSTLPKLLERHGVDYRNYDALVLDVQGSELLVLRGARSILRHFRFVQIEAVDFEMYAGACRVDDIEGFMGRRKFVEDSRFEMARHPRRGHCWEIVYRRNP